MNFVREGPTREGVLAVNADIRRVEFDRHNQRTLLAPFRLEARKRERVRCSSLVDWPVYPRLRGTMQKPTGGRNAGRRGAPANGHCGGSGRRWRGFLRASTGPWLARRRRPIVVRRDIPGPYRDRVIVRWQGYDIARGVKV